MDTTVTVQQLVELEQALSRYAHITAAKLGYGLMYNLDNVIGPIMKTVRKKLEGSDKLKAFNLEREKYLIAFRSKGSNTPSVEEMNEYIETLKGKHDVVEEIKMLDARQNELLTEEHTVKWRRICLDLEPGMKKDDPASQGILSAGDRRLFIRCGIMYDPEMEDLKENKEDSIKHVDKNAGEK